MFSAIHIKKPIRRNEKRQWRYPYLAIDKDGVAQVLEKLTCTINNS